MRRTLRCAIVGLANQCDIREFGSRQSMQVDGKSMFSDVSAARRRRASTHPEGASNARHQCSGSAAIKRPVDRLARLHLGKELEYVLPCIEGAFTVCIR